MEPYPISRILRGQCDEQMNKVELDEFISSNDSICCLGITASTLCYFYAIHLQQKMFERRGSAVVSQFNALRVLTRIDTKIQ